MSTSSIRGTVAGLGARANPAFAGGVVGVSLLALAYAVTVASVQMHTYVHVMSGVLWTGADLFMGLVLGPVAGGLDESESAALFRRLTPKTAFFLPSMALVTIAGGITLAQRVGWFSNAGPWLALFTAVNAIPILLLLGWRLDAYGDRRWQAAFAIVTVLSVQGFGFLLPGEIRMYQEMTSPDPDAGVIARIGERNAKLGGVQGVFQLSLVVAMVYLRYGGL